ncbi:exocyst complex component 1-like [Osmerus mordax]|uniref:exocyst complex component 1-like n=1 Tax=Osmerus mordax TaxID=8014 RepID=UPI00350FBCE1
MSSLLRDEMQKMVFQCEGQKLVEFIEIEEQDPGRHFLCVSVDKSKQVHICVVTSKKPKRSHKSGSKKKKKLLPLETQRLGLIDSYKITEVWLLQDLVLLDGRNADVDDPSFLLHFDKVRQVTAINSGAKYAMARALLGLSDKYCQSQLTLQNFDLAYIHPTCVYTDRGDCVVLLQICFYAVNLVCLSLCPVQLD